MQWTTPWCKVAQGIKKLRTYLHLEWGMHYCCNHCAAHKQWKNTCINFSPLSPSNFSGYTIAYIISNLSLFSGLISLTTKQICQAKSNWLGINSKTNFHFYNSGRTCFDLRMLITSFAEASPKTKSCSTCPMSRSPYSLINLLIFPAIWTRCNQKY